MQTENKKIASFSKEEREAMGSRAKELAAESRADRNKEQGEKDVLEAIAKMPDPDKSMAKHFHELVKEKAPSLTPKTWYGMPAYSRNEKVVCFFQGASKFKARYATIGFNDSAKLDDGAMWPVVFAIKKLSSVEEAKITALLKKALG